MNLSKWSIDHERTIFTEESSDRVDLAYFDNLLKGESREDGRKRLSQHRLSGTRRSLHQDIMLSLIHI